MKFMALKKYAALALAMAVSLSITSFSVVKAAQDVVLIDDNTGGYAATSQSNATITTVTGINGRAATDVSTRVQMPAHSEVNGTDLRIYQEYTLPSNFWATATSTKYIVFSAWVYGSGFNYAGLQEANGEWFTPFFTPSEASSWASGGWNKICFVYDRSSETSSKRGTTYAYINDVDVSDKLGGARTPWGQKGDSVTKIKFLVTNWNSGAMDVYFDDVQLYITDTMPDFSNSDDEDEANAIYSENYDGLSASMLTFYEGSQNPTVSLERSIGGKEYSDKSLKANKELGLDNYIWANVNQFMDPTVSCYTVEFDIYPQDDSFTGVALAEGWNEMTTDAIKVGDGTEPTQLIKNQWNTVKFIVNCLGKETSGSYVVANLKTDVYVNGNLAISGANKLGKFNGADNPEATTYPLRIRLNATNASDAFSVYLDNLKVLKIDETELSSIDMNSIAERNGRKIVPTAAQITLEYSEELNDSTITSENILLNGATANSQVTVEDKTVTIKLDSLTYGKVYKLDLSTATWKDLYGRALPTDEIVFEVQGKVEIADAGLYSGNAKLSQLTSGEITAKITGLTNNTTSGQDVTAILLLFKNGKLELRTQNAVTVQPSATVEELTVSITVPEMGSDNYELKLFVWDSVLGGISYTDSIKIEN